MRGKEPEGVSYNRGNEDQRDSPRHRSHPEWLEDRHLDVMQDLDGNPRETQTGQDSAVDQAFLGWDQGVSWGTPFRAFFPTLAPIPMLHLGTKSKTGVEAIAPLAN